MASVSRAALITVVREMGHMENLTHIKNEQIARTLDRSYRRLRVLLDNARGHEYEKKEVYAHVAPGQSKIVLPSDFFELRNLIIRKALSETLFT